MTSPPPLLRYERDAGWAQHQLWRRCVFVDWHGVLCDQPFWHSITQNPRHQQRVALAEAVRGLFSDRVALVEAWMRGLVDADRVVNALHAPDDRRCRDDFLYRRLFEDCRAMIPRADVLDALSALPELTLLAIATDNMDCFSDSIPRLRQLRGTFHAALCSSDLGVLKAEDPDRFFGRWLAEHGLRPSDAVLIDDSARNCARFERFGGHAIRFADVGQTIAELTGWLSSS
jgi:FMN phosphatase YigB (HAD superfamily)